MFYAQSNAKGHSYLGETERIAYHKSNSNARFMTHFTVEDQRSLGKMKLNVFGRQKLGSSKPCQKAQHAKLYSELLQA